MLYKGSCHYGCIAFEGAGHYAGVLGPDAAARC